MVVHLESIGRNKEITVFSSVVGPIIIKTAQYDENHGSYTKALLAYLTMVKMASISTGKENK